MAVALSNLINIFATPDGCFCESQRTTEMGHCFRCRFINFHCCWLVYVPISKSDYLQNTIK